ncbi:MAG: AzlC family ABC transporter permease [Tissierellaceae bacterium]
MDRTRDIKKEIKASINYALPIVVGYLPIALAFGLLSKNSSISIRDTSLLSFLVYAGASQFMAIDLIGAGVASSSILLATFLLNLRHMMMSASLAVELKDIPKKYIPLVAFGITDETFSVISFNKEQISLWFVLILNSLAFASWNIGTIIGYGVGEILPATLQSSLNVGLYAMFASLLFPEVKKSIGILFIFIVSALVYGLLYYSKIFTGGWDIILGVIISSIFGLFILKKSRGGSEN